MSHCSIENILLFTLRMYKNVFKYNINAFFFLHACMHACGNVCTHCVLWVREIVRVTSCMRNTYFENMCVMQIFSSAFIK